MYCRLDDYLSNANLTFNWSTNNCGHFASGWVQHETGRDCMSALPEMRCMRDTLRVRKELGGTLVEATTKFLGDPVDRTTARSGDIVRCAMDDAEMLGICTGPAALFLTDMYGMVSIPIQHATHVWRVA